MTNHANANAAKVPTSLRQRQSMSLIHPFKSMSELCLAHGLSPRKYENWRLTNCVVGDVQGLPQSYGRIVATDGMFALIIRADGSLGEYHVMWFKPRDMNDKPEANFQATRDSKLRKQLRHYV